jgi:hypothetical protein
MQLRRNIGPATSRGIEHIFLRHTPAIMPLRTCEMESSTLRERGRSDHGQPRAKSEQ